MQTETRTITMDNGIIIRIISSDDGTMTNTYMTIENAEILIGEEVSFVGSRPKKKP